MRRWPCPKRSLRGPTVPMGEGGQGLLRPLVVSKAVAALLEEPAVELATVVAAKWLPMEVSAGTVTESGGSCVGVEARRSALDVDRTVGMECHGTESKSMIEIETYGECLRSRRDPSGSNGYPECR